MKKYCLFQLLVMKMYLTLFLVHDHVIRNANYPGSKNHSDTGQTLLRTN